jgi:toxin ParE1/3/4
MKLVFHAAALSDLQSIYDYIARENPGIASAVLARIKASLDRLIEFPKSGRAGKVRGTYEAVIPGLPYIAVYELTVEQIEILAVFHAAQDRS